MQKNLLCLGLFFLLCSCATTGSSVNTKDIKKDEGLFFGKVNVMIDNEDITSNCYIGAKDKDGKRAVYFSLDESGLFSGVAKKGEVWISELRCRKGMTHYNFLWDRKEYVFKNIGNSKKTYIGDISFEWNSKYDNNNYALLLLGGLGAGIAANQSQRLHNLKVETKNGYKQTNRSFLKTVESSKHLKKAKSLLKRAGRGYASEN